VSRLTWRIRLRLTSIPYRGSIASDIRHKSFVLHPFQCRYRASHQRSCQRYEDISVDPEYTYGYILGQVVFFCPDPRYYSSNEQTATLLYSPPTGRIYDRTYNLTYGGGSATMATTISNNGWTDTYPTITLTGPITNPCALVIRLKTPHLTSM
jgi:hypothetical protein